MALPGAGQRDPDAVSRSMTARRAVRNARLIGPVLVTMIGLAPCARSRKPPAFDVQAARVASMRSGRCLPVAAGSLAGGTTVRTPQQAMAVVRRDPVYGHLLE